MKHLDLTLPSPEANLACDEALLDLCEQGFEHEILRFWEPDEPFIVLGYANRADEEVKLDVCRAKNIPVLRRCTGGGTVVQGPGCLNYSLVLKIAASGPLQSITGTNSFIMERHRNALTQVLGRCVEIQGYTDLTIGNVKFSGNAQRRKRKFLIFHGSILLHFDLALIEEVLLPPPKQPAYRQNRSHLHFLTNLAVPSLVVKEALIQAWTAYEKLAKPPWKGIEQLVRDRYSQSEWNSRF
jgi:lipoate-protein ligase A